MEIEIKDYWELVALHKSLMAAKFDPEPYIEELQGSPYTSSIAFKVFDLLVKSCKPEEIEQWLTWQQADKSRAETMLLLERIKVSTWWPKANKDDRIKYVKDFMAPLKLQNDLENEIVKSC